MTLISIFNGHQRALGDLDEAGQRVFVQIDVKFLDVLHQFHGAALSVLMALALRSNQDGWSWPSIETLQRDTGLSRNSIFRALDYLCSQRVNGRRVLLRARLRNPDGTLGTNCYLLFPTPAEEEEFSDAELVEYPTDAPPTKYQKVVLGNHVPSTTFTNVVKLHPNNNHDLEHDDDNDDDKRRSESEIVRIEQIVRAVWEGATGRPMTPEEWQILESLITDHQVPSTRLLALIPNLALRVGRDALSVDLLQAAALGDLVVPGLDASVPLPAPAPPLISPEAPQAGGDRDPVLAEVVAMYEAEIGIMSPLIAEELKALTAEVRDMARWREAFRAAVAANVRRWSYVKACLQSDGRRPPTAAARQSGPGRARSVRARVVTPEEMPPMPEEEPLPPID
jgi:hypothetical protein